MNIKQHIIASVVSHAEQINTINDKIWSYAELDFRVKRSADVLCEALKQEGFQVQRGLAGIEHAFTASHGNGSPVIGFLAEYDAFSNLSQVAGCPVVLGGNGRGYGHCALAAGAYGAAVAVKEYLEKTDCAGTVILYGCPAEEDGWAKAFMAGDGCFDQLDFALTWHPYMENFVMDRSSLANIKCTFFL